ncbi:MAG: 1-deoxy-D-xylulose-5-phosphate synthase [Bacteroidota bacterium]
MSDSFNILRTINYPTDLRKIPTSELPILCDELREYIINVISHNPGHLGASLGTVELTVALHYAFNTPIDKLIWDVGHQAYSHKILTGRKELFKLNRMQDGISGFPKMKENIYDAFGTGHSSTSISAALGMAIAAKLNGDNQQQHIAVIGDGSMTGGMAFEAMNHAGWEKANVLVILNDNGISIDKSVGALKEYLLDITTSKAYNRLKKKIWNVLSFKDNKASVARDFVQQFENALKGTLLKKSNLFESLGFRYFGPVDGHDVERLVKIFNDLKQIPGPKLLHIRTVKGKGLRLAEIDQTKYHAPGFFNPETGELIPQPCKNDPPRYQEVFGETIVALAKRNPKIIGVTPAMASGCSLDLMMNAMPTRTFDVGIAEQHAVTFSAGMAASGYIPFCNIYSTFLQRSYDQIIHDVAIQKLSVIFCIDRGGLVGEDGATHHGVYDIAFLRCIPNMIVASPMNEHELRNLMYTAQLKPNGPFAIRYPRGKGVLAVWRNKMEEITIGKGRQLKMGQQIAVISIGHIGNLAADALLILEMENISVSHYDLRFVKPIDQDLLHEAFKNHHTIITVEDGTIVGGMGSAVTEFMTENQYCAKIIRLGVPDVFIEQGTIAELRAECGIDTDHIVAAVKKYWINEE